MIGRLRGKVVASAPERVVLEVAGIGFDVQVSLNTFYEIERAAQDGEPVQLFIHTHVREDALELFGFWSEREKGLFERLIAVSGIGPRLARSILSGMAPDDLIIALAAGDVVRLSRTPGVGKKTAERMVLELKDKVRELAPEAAVPTEPGPEDDLVAALVSLGYKAAEAERAIREARKELPSDAPFHELLRASLRRLSRA